MKMNQIWGYKKELKVGGGLGIKGVGMSVLKMEFEGGYKKELEGGYKRRWIEGFKKEPEWSFKRSHESGF